MTNDERKTILESIATANGGVLTPDAVVAAAAVPDHPLHGDFEWADRDAAHAYRLDQARAIIRSVKVVIRTETVQIKSVFYVRDPRAIETGEQGYLSLPRLRTDRELAEEAVAREFARIREAAERALGIAMSLGMDAAALRAHAILRALDPFAAAESEVESATT